jgi:serine/threonine protein kinase
LEIVNSWVKKAIISEYSTINCEYERVSEQKASGGFATVYKVKKKKQAENNRHKEDVHYALKKIEVKKETYYELIENEITILRGLRHNNVLRLREAYFLDGNPLIIFLVTEPWAHLTLQKFIDCVRDKKSEALDKYSNISSFQLAIQGCLEGMQYLHTQKPRILHKDLKPHNILLLKKSPSDENSYFHVIIADFGISKMDQGQPTKNYGTPEYWAPEQDGGEGATNKSDVWSLGCCFTFILVYLWKGDAALRHFYNITVGSPQPKFLKNIERVRQHLEELSGGASSEATSTSETTRDQKFLDDFKALVYEMLKQEPEERPCLEKLCSQYAMLTTSRLPGLESLKIQIYLVLPDNSAKLKEFDAINLSSRWQFVRSIDRFLEEENLNASLSEFGYWSQHSEATLMLPFLAIWKLPQEKRIVTKFSVMDELLISEETQLEELYDVFLRAKFLLMRILPDSIRTGHFYTDFLKALIDLSTKWNEMSQSEAHLRERSWGIVIPNSKSAGKYLPPTFSWLVTRILEKK